MELKDFKCLGSGVHGVIYGATMNGNKYAIKCWKVSSQIKAGHVNIKELDMYKNLSHPNIVGNCEVIPYKLIKDKVKEKGRIDKFCIMYKRGLCNLQDHMKSISSFPSMLSQLLQGLDYLHKNGIVHRDIKSNNILLYPNDNYKIIDYGLSKFLCNLSSRNSTGIGTKDYMAPELLLSKRDYKFGVDIWSLAIICIESLLGRIPFVKVRGDSSYNRCIKIFEFLGYPTDDILSLYFDNPLPITDRKDFNIKRSLPFTDDQKKKIGDVEAFYDLLSKMLSYDYKNRISAEECLNHPYFNNKCTIYKLPDDNRLFEAVNSKYKTEGYKVFQIYHATEYQDEFIKKYKDRILFLGLDIYERCFIVKLEGSPWHIAYSSIYIAYKYYLDFHLVGISELFPKVHNITRDLRKLEKVILSKVLKFSIFRKSIYEWIPTSEISKKRIDQVFDMITNGSDDIMGLNLKEIGAAIIE